MSQPHVTQTPQARNDTTLQDSDIVPILNSSI